MMSKKSPQLRFEGFTDDWEVRKLGSLTTVVRGASPRPIQDPKWFDKESDIGWLRIADVTEQNGRIYHLEQHISKLGQEKTRVLTEPHLLLSIAATVGKPVVNYVKTGVHDGFLIFLNPTFEREFMFQWLEMFRPKWQKYGQPGSQVNLNSELVRNQEIVLPNYKEQQKIGSFFKHLDNTIALHQRKLDLLKEQKKGFLQKMFPKNGAKVPELRFAGFADDWEERKLGDITKISTGKLDANAMVENGKYDFYTSGIKKYRIDVAAFEGPSITIAGNGATVGYMHLADNKFNAYQRTYVLQEFLVDRSFIFSEIGNKLPKKIKQEARTGNIPYIVMDMLTELKLSIPQNNSEQQKIGSFFKQLDDNIDLHQRKLDLLKEQKKGFLQKMFV
ncbi:restriction endonuclease subunit S [Pseudolactococcus carnosus]|uniref:restriction endonuclease subunit S n=1 Tax=Pseudolactococcus carnosus TaxID=2749961 RepID=UPI001FB9F8D9|nr:restriction endonuclease subunit S [Lactococcus carnosus]MCJ1972283.1 restriction endonuclease subunit S [Lactococcus carnosus]